jgi:hypothetical protein
MVVVKLPFAEVSEARFVDQGGRGRPGLAQVELLVARAVNRAEARQIGARAFEGGKGLRLRVVIEVAVEAQLVVVATVTSAVRGVFTVALYRYAKAGSAPSGFSADAIDGALGGRRRIAQQAQAPWDAY